jgi:hypothetical protein
VGLRSLLEIDLNELLTLVERRCDVKLPRDVVEVYLGREHDLLFVRFKEPEGPEVGEPLPTRTPLTLFTEEDTGWVTALEIIGVNELLRELGG